MKNIRSKALGAIMILWLQFISIFLLASSLHASQKITILTYPVGKHSQNSWYHPAVTNSLLRGLQELQVNFNYNPSQENDVGQTVVVLTNIDALKQAIVWKRKGRIKKLLAGPNLVVSPKEHHGVVLSPEIDIYMVNSQWTKTAYTEDAPSLINHIGIWPAGIDIRFWNPSLKLTDKKNRNALVYWKTESIEFCNEVEQVLKKYNWNPIRIRYGQYDLQTYKNTLENSLFAVFISRSESQGLALAEAWAMDVPTLVWNPKALEINGRVYSESSACPYLSPQTGFDWQTIKEFENILKSKENLIPKFTPRSWVLDNMSDAASTQILLSLINSIPM